MLPYEIHWQERILKTPNGSLQERRQGLYYCPGNSSNALSSWGTTFGVAWSEAGCSPRPVCCSMWLCLGAMAEYKVRLKNKLLTWMAQVWRQVAACRGSWITNGGTGDKGALVVRQATDLKVTFQLWPWGQWYRVWYGMDWTPQLSLYLAFGNKSDPFGWRQPNSQSKELLQRKRISH